jgi:hypothetical protein
MVTVVGDTAYSRRLSLGGCRMGAPPGDDVDG